MFVQAWLWAGLATYCKASGNVVKESEVDIISSGPLIIRIGFLLTVNACGFLKVFMAKSGQLDPIAVYYGYADDTAIKIMRCLISVLAVACFGTLYFSGVYSQPMLIAVTKSLMDLPTGTLIMKLLSVALLLTGVLSHIVSKLYDHDEESEKNRVCPCLGNIQFCCRDNDTENNGNTISGTHMFVPVVGISLLLLSLVLFLLRLMGMIPLSGPWQLSAVMATIQGIILPTTVIFKSSQVKEYAKRKIGNVTTPLLAWLEVAVTSLMWIRRSTRITPED